MCGICGVIGEGRSELAESYVRGMLGALVHRGPDDEGLLAAPGAALGMRRLTIIDLGGGRQPIFNEDGTVGIVFNGEIYNFPELREQLDSRGHRFRTHSDTEVIVHAYEEWGDQCLQRLRGMFAFALWDGRAPGGRAADGGATPGRVLLARDRLGIKPLYFSYINDGAASGAPGGGRLIFASEVRALLASGAVPRRLSPQAVESYLFFGSVVEPMTLVEGVFSLPPGHALSVACAAPRQAEPRAYWDLAAAAQSAAAAAPANLAAAGRAVRPLLEQAVRSHLLADVPLGLFLSSGLDSTALAALAARERSGLHTFTVVFPEQEFSEAAMARRTAERLGTRHQELLLTGDEMLARLGEAVGALDQPSMDGINTFFVSWAARRVGLKVALSGLGGDEVFGGYPTFRSTPRLAVLAALGRGLPTAARRPLAAALAGIVRKTGGAGNHSDAAAKIAAIWNRPRALPHPYFFARMLFTPEQVETLLPAAGRDAASAHAASPWRAWLEQSVGQAERLSGDSAVSVLELRTYMLDTLLRDTDAMSMHHSLEVRVPLLDHPLVEFVAGVPTSAKRKKGVPKALLVEALGDLLPAEVIRQPKRTFTFPWERWLRGPLGSQVERCLGGGLAPSLSAVLDGGEVQSVWRSFSLGRTGWARPWSLFVLNEWARRHLDQLGDALPGQAEAAGEPNRTELSRAGAGATAN